MPATVNHVANGDFLYKLKLWQIINGKMRVRDIESELKLNAIFRLKNQSLT